MDIEPADLEEVLEMIVPSILYQIQHQLCGMVV